MFRFRGDAAPRAGVELHRLDTFAAEHHGLITRGAAMRAGMSSASWYRALHHGRLEPVHQNVARMYGAPVTPEQTIAAAVLAAGPGAMASHRSAAFLWGVPGGPPDVIDVLLVRRSREAKVTGAAVHRPRDQRDLSPVLCRNIRTTNILRTLCDLGAVAPSAVPGAVGHVVTSGLASPVALREAIRRHSRRGRPGVPALRDALDEWVIDAKPVDSVLEPAMRDLVRRYGLPPVEFHPVIGPYEIDFRICGSPILLECDGWKHHGLDRRRYEQDKIRDAELSALGWVVVRFTYRRIVRAAAKEADRIRRIIHRWAPELLAPSTRTG